MGMGQLGDMEMGKGGGAICQFPSPQTMHQGSELSGDGSLQEQLEHKEKELREAREMVQELRKHERELTDR